MLLALTDSVGAGNVRLWGFRRAASHQVSLRLVIRPQERKKERERDCMVSLLSVESLWCREFLVTVNRSLHP